MINMAGKKTKINGIMFDSELEASHYVYFMAHPNIKVIELQPSYELQEKFKYEDPFTCKSGTRSFSNMIYTGDFLIEVEGIDYPIVIESKGFKRPDYMLRRKLFIYQYVIDKPLYWVEITSLKQLVEIFDKYKEG
jgi:hypothetical protein